MLQLNNGIFCEKLRDGKLFCENNLYIAHTFGNDLKQNIVLKYFISLLLNFIHKN